MREFWPRPDWHAKGLPTREELRAENRRLAQLVEYRMQLLRELADEED